MTKYGHMRSGVGLHPPGWVDPVLAAMIDLDPVTIRVEQTGLTPQPALVARWRIKGVTSRGDARDSGVDILALQIDDGPGPDTLLDVKGERGVALRREKAALVRAVDKQPESEALVEDL